MENEKMLTLIVMVQCDQMQLWDLHTHGYKVGFYKPWPLKALASIPASLTPTSYGF